VGIYKSIDKSMPTLCKGIVQMDKQREYERLIDVQFVDGGCDISVNIQIHKDLVVSGNLKSNNWQF
jgi:hypothetical protein